MDAGEFKEAIDYIVRNNIPYGNLKVINKYGDFVEITRKDIRFNNYKKKIKRVCQNRHTLLFVKKCSKAELSQARPLSCRKDFVPLRYQN